MFKTLTFSRDSLSLSQLNRLLYDLKSPPNMRKRRSHPLQPQIVHQNVALVMAVLTIVHKNIIQRMICNNHHPHLKRDTVIQPMANECGCKQRRFTLWS